jgi:hypothetical protein
VIYRLHSLSCPQSEHAARISMLLLHGDGKKPFQEACRGARQKSYRTGRL